MSEVEQQLDDEEVCGYTFDHDIEETYSGPDGWQGLCRRCGAEFWEDEDGDFA